MPSLESRIRHQSDDLSSPSPANNNSQNKQSPWFIGVLAEKLISTAIGKDALDSGTEKTSFDSNKDLTRRKPSASHPAILDSKKSLAPGPSHQTLFEDGWGDACEDLEFASSTNGSINNSNPCVGVDQKSPVAWQSSDNPWVDNLSSTPLVEDPWSLAQKNTVKAEPAKTKLLSAKISASQTKPSRPMVLGKSKPTTTDYL